jgi:hypothetical protein
MPTTSRRSETSRARGRRAAADRGTRGGAAARRARAGRLRAPRQPRPHLTRRGGDRERPHRARDGDREDDARLARLALRRALALARDGPAARRCRRRGAPRVPRALRADTWVVVRHPALTDDERARGLEHGRGLVGRPYDYGFRDANEALYCKERTRRSWSSSSARRLALASTAIPRSRRSRTRRWTAPPGTPDQIDGGRVVRHVRSLRRRAERRHHPEVAESGW